MRPGGRSRQLGAASECENPRNGSSNALKTHSIERLAMLAILTLALVVRVAFAALFPDQSAVLPDSIEYRMAAHELASGHLIANDYLMPGYPALIALTGGRLGQYAADIALSVLSVWCLARIVREITGDAFSALTAALIWAVYPFSLFYTAVGLTENLFVTLVLLGFLAFYRSAFLLGSVAMTAAILTRPSVELLTPILILAFALVVHRTGWKKALRHVVGFIVIYVVMMAPWWWHNELKYGQFVRLDLGSGYVLYSGNNPMNTSGGGIAGVDVDPNAYRNIADPVARDRAFREAAFRYIADHPRRFISMAWVKLARLWRPWPYAAQYAKPALIVVSVATLLPLMLLALIGLPLWIGRWWRPLVPIVLFIGFNTAVPMVTIGSVRYRFPMEPFLVVLAAPVVVDGIRRLLASSARPRTEAPLE